MVGYIFLSYTINLLKNYFRVISLNLLRASCEVLIAIKEAPLTKKEKQNIKTRHLFQVYNTRQTIYRVNFYTVVNQQICIRDYKFACTEKRGR